MKEIGTGHVVQVRQLCIAEFLQRLQDTLQSNEISEGRVRERACVRQENKPSGPSLYHQHDKEVDLIHSITSISSLFSLHSLKNTKTGGSIVRKRNSPVFTAVMQDPFYQYANQSG